ncbi:hypothetical protein SADUNF_Sadunf12G0087600 [Salix dunnii]|uniref:Uncharacterized protein n=1 Tax=Salix dunnii TaxID=1413687 RepID=A0A835MW77_9ROSI|nr:hypothetical protein SADUNF_Sadunf12G0087600 [Salix dunnii]
MASPKEADNNPDTPSSPKKIYKDPDDGRQRELTKKDIFRYPHCLYFLELLQNVNFRNAMAHPGNKHRPSSDILSSSRGLLRKNNRLKHFLPRPLPEPVTAPPAPAPPPQLPAQPVSAATLGMPAASSAVLSPMPYGMAPGSAFGKSDIRSSGSDRRKRNFWSTRHELQSESLYRNLTIMS